MNWSKPNVYALSHKDESVRVQSRSGGVFTALSDYVFSKNGIVYGCILDDTFNAVHIRVDNAYERNRMRGSKYVQSKLGETYKKVKNDLASGRLVLFSGTSCQIAGLQMYLSIPGDFTPRFRKMETGIPE